MRQSRAWLSLAAALGAAGILLLAFVGGYGTPERQELLGRGRGGEEARRWAARSEQLVLDDESEAKHLFFECKGEELARACMAKAGQCLDAAEARVASVYATDPLKATEQRVATLCACFGSTGCAPQCNVAMYMLWATQTKLQCPMQQPTYVPEARAWQYGDADATSPDAAQFSRDYYPTFPNPGGFDYGSKRYNYAFETPGAPPAVRAYDFDGDGRPDAFGYDVDGDGQADYYAYDRDHDGRPDVYSYDWNRDGRNDVYSYDYNHDGVPDTYGYDYNGDGVPDHLAPAAQGYYYAPRGGGVRRRQGDLGRYYGQAWPAEDVPAHRHYDGTNIYYRPLARDNYRMTFPRAAPSPPAYVPPKAKQQPREGAGGMYRHNPTVWYIPKFNRHRASRVAGTGPAMVNWVFNKDT